MSANANIRAGRAYVEVTAETSKLRANLNAAVRDSRWSPNDASHGNGCRNHLATLRRRNAHL